MMSKAVSLQKSKIGFSILLIASMMLGFVSSIVSAHNWAGVVKALNLLGYEYVNDTTDKLNIFFDKGLTGFQAGQIKIQPVGGSPINFTASTSTGTGWTHTMSPQGTIVTITPSSGYEFTPNTRYQVTVSSTVRMGNSFGLTVGNYSLHKDVVFYVKTPAVDGVTYSGTPQLTFLPVAPGEEHAGLSANVAAISDIPIKTTSLTLSDFKLQKYNSGTQTFDDVTIDTTLDTSAQSGAEAYATQINDAHTCVFIPLTIKQNNTPVYNLLSENTEYKMIVPDDLKSVNDGEFEDADYTFTTGEDTSASLWDATPSVTGYTSNSVSLSWADVSEDESGLAPDHYHVYYSTNPYFGFVKAADTVNYSGNPNTCTVTGLSSSTTYYFRVVPANEADEEGGFSEYVSQITATN